MLHLGAEDPVGLAELVDVLVEQRDVEAEADGDLGGVPAGDAAADDDGAARAARPAHRPAARRGRPPSASGGTRRPAGRSGRRPRTSGPAAAARGWPVSHGLVRDGGRARLQQRVGALAGGGEVEVGEERLVLAQPPVLLGDRLLDLEHHVGGGPDLVGGAEDGGSGGDVLLVRDGGADAGARAPRATWCPLRTSSCTPAGVMATRNSLFLTSRGMPTFTSITVLDSGVVLGSSPVGGRRERPWRTTHFVCTWEACRMLTEAARSTTAPPV